MARNQRPSCLPLPFRPQRVNICPKSCPRAYPQPRRCKTGSPRRPGRRLRNFTLDEVAPEPLDVDDIVLTLYKLEKLKEEDNLRLVSAAETDYAYLKKARMGFSSKLWTYESETNELLDYVRKMPADKFMEFMLDMGLYERLRGEIDADTEGSGGAPHLTAL